MSFELFSYRKLLNQKTKKLQNLGRKMKKNIQIFINQPKFYGIFKLCQLLLEDFFSICGVTCNKRNSKMNDEAIIMRYQKANIRTLNELNIKQRVETAL